MDAIILITRTLVLLVLCLAVSKAILDGFFERKFQMPTGHARDKKTKRWQYRTKNIERTKQPLAYWVQMFVLNSVLLCLLLILAPDLSNSWTVYLNDW